MSDNTSPTPPTHRWKLEVYGPEGQATMTLGQTTQGVTEIHGDPTYLEDLVHALTTLRFFRDGPRNNPEAS